MYTSLQDTAFAMPEDHYIVIADVISVHDIAQKFRIRGAVRLSRNLYLSGMRTTYRGEMRLALFAQRYIITVRAFVGFTVRHLLSTTPREEPNFSFNVY